MLIDGESRMATLGLVMLEPTKTAETAEAKRIDKSGEDSALATTARSLVDGLEELMRFHALWLNLGPDAGGSVDISANFEDLALDPAMVSELRAMVAEGSMSLDTLWSRLKAGRILPESFDAAKERERIEEDSATRLPTFTPKPPVPPVPPVPPPPVPAGGAA
jgi:hypothetical protein